MMDVEIKKILQEHKNHLVQSKSYYEKDEDIAYWDGALDCIEYLSEQFRGELK